MIKDLTIICASLLGDFIRKLHCPCNNYETLLTSLKKSGENIQNKILPLFKYVSPGGSSSTKSPVWSSTFFLKLKLQGFRYNFQCFSKYRALQSFLFVVFNQNGFD